MAGNTKQGGSTGQSGSGATGANLNVLVIGGGYSGVMAANRLQQRDGVTVTLVNPRPAFVQRLRLHQFVGGSHDALADYGEVMAPEVGLVQDTVTRIEADRRTVTLASGGTLDYDYLVYAVGSASAVPPVPGGEFTYPMATLEAAERLRSALDATPTTAALTVVGAGPTGIETAAELAERGRRVTLLCGGVLGAYLHPRARRAVARRLGRLGVTVLDGPGTRVTAVTHGSVELRDGRRLPSELTVWTAGFGVPDLAARSGLRTDAVGRLLTDETLTSLDDERIVAAGDSAAPSDLPFRMSAYVAGCLGAHAADTVLDRSAGRTPAPVDLSFPAMCISLGRGTAVFQFGHKKSESGTPVHVGGRSGAKLKEFACQSAIKHVVNEAHKPGTHTWHKGLKHRQRQLAARDTAPAAVQPTAQ